MSKPPRALSNQVQRSLAGSLFCLLCLNWCTPVFAQPGLHLDPLSWDRNVAGLVRKYCLDCHNSTTAKGDVDLAKDFNPRLIQQNRDVWETAQGMIEGEAMPPGKAKQPTPEERQQMINFLAKTLGEIDCSTVQDPGPPPFRRLNNVEYNNSIRDLTGLEISPGDEFPPDTTSYGFDNIGAALNFSPVQIEQYHKAASATAAQLLAQNPTVNGWPSLLLPVAPPDGQPARDTARTIITRFATKAFRRPVEPEYVDRLMGIYDFAIERGDSPTDSLGHLLTAVMTSPRFLIRLEASDPDQVEPFPIDGYELASRLSYFIWSSPPDEELFQLAGDGTLLKPEVLEQQTRRLLSDPRSMALVRNFFGQWLELQKLKDHQPDQKTFPEFNIALRTAMAQEVEQFLREIVQENKPIRELIDSDYTYLNQQLASLYGIPDVTGEEFRRVRLTSRQRGGILTSAAVLMLQADPDRTNIPRRGNYIAGRILGDAPPPPPPDVPALPSDGPDITKLTLRERLALHREKAECASCHARIDPLGFALENYDALGRWRDQENGRPVDPSGEMPDGSKITSPADLKEILLQHEDKFAKTFINNLMIYALGRSLQNSDECTLRDLRKLAETQDGRFADLVVGIVQSPQFRYRKNAE